TPPVNRAGDGSAPLSVLQSVQTWLPQTATWLYTQVRFLPPGIESTIACERTAHLDQFPFPRIRCLKDAPTVSQIRDRALRRLGVRHHLSFTLDAGRRAGARVVHSHFGVVGWRDLAVARRLGAAHAVTFYGVDVRHYPQSDPRWFGRYQEMFAQVDAVLCEGPFMGQAIVDLGCPKEKLRIHHLGVDLAAIPFAPLAWEPGQPLRVLLSGSFREKKGFPDAIDALGRVGNEVAVEITIIGDAHGLPSTVLEKKKILEALARNGLAERTRLLGYQPHRVVMDEASRHHVFLSPSVTASDGDTEGGAPVSLIEMSAAGLMVVSTTHCDIPGVVIHGKTGLLAPEHDIDALAAHLRWLVANPSLWRAMGAAARAHIEAEFDARRQGERLAAIYREIGAGHATGMVT
ncbi:MAG TPA: glycosyltransferase, partial [Candidatus Krumholzibacteria bacterium]|nr:glycosyltransferase [Candidatus Krumholzibacteria bacterium]